LDYVRALDIPVIHVVLTLRPIEVATFSFQKAILATHHSITPSTTSDILKHNLEGSIQTDLMPEIGPREGDFIINNKKTASAFIGTDLDNLLRILNIDTLVLIGVNTNTCILSSAFDAFNRGFSTIVNSDCVSSMYGEDLHFFALQNISRCIGWVMSTEELKAKLQDPAEFPVS
jgi:nicotinamidase-related amidase